MWLTRTHHAVKKVEKVEDIPPLFDWGRKYLPDPLNGKLDFLAHPSLLEKRSDFLLPFGDCDDHAIYWATKIKISNLADRVWFCFYSMVDKDKKISGHAVCVFTKDNFLYWCDYQDPYKIGRAVKQSGWDFAPVSAARFGNRPIAAARWEIMSVDLASDTPIFGKVETETGF